MPRAVSKQKAPGLSTKPIPVHKETVDDGTATPDRRKLRNRMSQRAFRARQTMRIQELEERLKQWAGQDAAVVNHLQDQNAQLREQLLQVYKKATSISISMKALADAASQALGIETPNTRTTSDENTARSSPTVNQRAESHGLQDTNTAAVQEPVHAVDASSPTSHTEPHAATGDPADTMIASIPALCADGNVLAEPSDNSWSAADVGFFSDCMQGQHVAADWEARLSLSPYILGLVAPQPSVPELTLSPSPAHFTGLEHYADLLQRASPVFSNLPLLRRTNSPFSDHIEAMEASLGTRWKRKGSLVKVDKRLLSSIDFMIQAFVRISWIHNTGWETYTKSITALKDLTAWRLQRTPEAWEKIIPNFRPTKLQMSVPHPAVIDWIPHPSLRDKLIIHHSSNPRLDEIISEIGASYVVQTDLSILVRCRQPVIGYVPVWALVKILAESDLSSASNDPIANNPALNTHDIYREPSGGAGPGPPTHSIHPLESVALPASDANELFNNPRLARAAHQLLGIDKGAFRFRLDPSFFVAHPELYDAQADIVAHGVPLRPPGYLPPVPVPEVLQPKVIELYQRVSGVAVECAG